MRRPGVNAVQISVQGSIVTLDFSSMSLGSSIDTRNVSDIARKAQFF
jgi:hypothetical protein